MCPRGLVGAMKQQNTVFTIGHSASDLDVFLAALQTFEITLLVDVRSRPRSLRFPHFDQEELQQSLRAAGIRYLFLGEELGGRPDDPAAYHPDGLVDYAKRQRSFAFQSGLERVLCEVEQNTVALMCAEEDPLDCHRFLMICPALVGAGIEPKHIRKGAVLETQNAAEDRLLEAHHFSDVTSAALFRADRISALQDAYVAQARKCAFRADPQALDYW